MPTIRYTLRREDEELDLTIEFLTTRHSEIVDIFAFEGNKEIKLTGEELATVEQYIIDNPPEPDDEGWEPEHG